MFFAIKINAQKTIKLEEVTVKSFKTIKDELVKIKLDSLDFKTGSFADEIKQNTPIFIKEYGQGLLSNVSFRGTSSSHTAVLWNGISINSKLNGATDFNTLALTSDDITISTSSGNIMNGSGSIGGAISLVDNTTYNKLSDSQLYYGYGSFDTSIYGVQTKQASENTFLKIALNHKKSQNNYPYPDTDLTNTNASFSNININANFGIKLNDKQQIKAFFNSSLIDRDIPGSLTFRTNSNLKMEMYRTMLEWLNNMNAKNQLSLKVAYLKEIFDYVQDKKSPVSSVDQSNNYIVKLNYGHVFNRQFYINSFVNYEKTKAIGDNLMEKQRDEFAVVARMVHQPFALFSYEIQLQKNYSSVYESPFLYGVHLNLKPFSNYKISFNTSKNFQIPTINDLFFKYGGNPNLKPELSYQFENVHQLDFNWLKLNFTAFYLDNKNLIEWRDTGNNIWKPINVSNTVNYGGEFTSVFQKNKFKLKLNYAYTKATYKGKNKQLRYVPEHQANLELSYVLSKIKLIFQQEYVSEVSTGLTELKPYAISNFGLNYKPFEGFKIGGKLYNLTNTKYQIIKDYPMPLRRFQVELSYCF